MTKFWTSMLVLLCAAAFISSAPTPDSDSSESKESKEKNEKQCTGHAPEVTTPIVPTAEVANVAVTPAETPVVAITEVVTTVVATLPEPAASEAAATQNEA